MFPEDNNHCEYIVAGKLSSPTCQQLGIPRDEKQPIRFNQMEMVSETEAHDCYTSKTRTKVNPFSPYCMIPLPTPFGSGLFDPACLRRRNERERDRVRCVNEGYLRLKEHLPINNKDKRISKVDTLRIAIRYIKHLQTMLSDDVTHLNDDVTRSYHGNFDCMKSNVDSESDSDTLYNYSTDSYEANSDSECK